MQLGNVSVESEEWPSLGSETRRIPERLRNAYLSRRREAEACLDHIPYENGMARLTHYSMILSSSS
jgi:hypothetical protein